MAQMSNYLEEQLMNHVFRGIAYTSPGTVYMALYSTAQTEADGGLELTGDGYARIALSVGAPVDGVSVNDVEALFAAASANWLPIVAVDVRDALTGGNSLMYKDITSSSILLGNQFRSPVGEFTLIFD